MKSESTLDAYIVRLFSSGASNCLVLFGAAHNKKEQNIKKSG